MRNKGANISKANFIFKCHVEIGQGRENTEKGNYNSKAAQSTVQEDAPLVLIYVNMTPIRDTEVDSQDYKQGVQFRQNGWGRPPDSTISHLIIVKRTEFSPRPHLFLLQTLSLE